MTASVAAGHFTLGLGAETLRRGGGGPTEPRDVGGGGNVASFGGSGGGLVTAVGSSHRQRRQDCKRRGFDEELTVGDLAPSHRIGTQPLEEPADIDGLVGRAGGSQPIERGQKKTCESWNPPNTSGASLALAATRAETAELPR